MIRSEIRMSGNRPILYLDGSPATPMAYTTYFEERSDAAAFAQAGYRIFFVNLSFTSLPINNFTGFTPFRVGAFENPDAPDFSAFETAVRAILTACPDAVIFPRIYVSMPKSWADTHPDDVVPTPKGGFREALFSDAFRRDRGETTPGSVRRRAASRRCGGRSRPCGYAPRFDVGAPRRHGGRPPRRGPRGDRPWGWGSRRWGERLPSFSAY